MLSISNLSIHFAGNYLFNKVSFSIRKNDRIGLTGRNGTGKSTLLKIITGIESPEEGRLVKPKDFTIGYLPQEGNIYSEKTVWEETSSALFELKQNEKLIDEISAALSERTDYESKEYKRLLQKLTEANERFEALGGASIEAEIEQILTGLGFDREDFNRPLTEFSGGWQMRIEIAKILLSRPDLILLDEPTNHLDIESIRWLENFLKNYPGAIIIVSHDTRFLETICNRTMEISGGRIFDMDLPYLKFIIERSEQRKQQLAAFKNQQKKIAETERFIERFRYKATLASRVQSRIKQLDKMELIEIDEEDLSSIRFTFPAPPRSGKIVVEISKLSKRYGDNIVLDQIDFVIERGDKIAFVGKNGEGKSTLSMILAGKEDYSGGLKAGYNVETGFYAQHQAEMLDGNSTVFEIIDNAATGEMRTQVRNLLGAFLFSGEAIYKKVKTLSGGEKSRLAIAKLLLRQSNFLILDEPTNHLDTVAKDVLKEALLNYPGSMIIVSHDRDFLHGLTNKTIEFKHGKINEYHGDINEFLEKQELLSLRQLEKTINQNAKPETTTPASSGFAKLTREKQKAFDRELSRKRRLISECELEIESIERKIAAFEESFAEPEFISDIDRSQQIQAEYHDLRKLLTQKTDEWAELEEELEKFLGKSLK